MTDSTVPPVPALTAPAAQAWTLYPERGEDMAGAVLGGRFEAEKRVGMTEVFLSKDLLLHGLAAVKVLRERNTDARRFAGARVRSRPHVCQPDAGRADSRKTTEKTRQNLSPGS